MSYDLVLAMRTLVYMTPGMTIRSLCEEALIRHMSEISEGAKSHLEDCGLRPGRPVKITSSLDTPK